MYLPVQALVPTIVGGTALAFTVFMTTYLSLQKYYNARDQTRSQRVDLEAQTGPIRRLVVQEGRTVPVTPVDDLTLSLPPMATLLGPPSPLGSNPPIRKSASSRSAPETRLSRRSSRKPTKYGSLRLPQRTNWFPQESTRPALSTWHDNINALRQMDDDFQRGPPLPMAPLGRTSNSVGSRRMGGEMLANPRPSRESQRPTRASRLPSVSVGQSSPSNMLSPTCDGFWSTPDSRRTSVTTIRPQATADEIDLYHRHSLSSGSRRKRSNATIRVRASSLSTHHDCEILDRSPSLARRVSSMDSSASRLSNLHKPLPPLPRVPSPTLQTWGDIRRRELDAIRPEERASRIISPSLPIESGPMPTIVEPLPRRLTRNSPERTIDHGVPRLSLKSFGPDFPDASVTSVVTESAAYEKARESILSTTSEDFAVCRTSQRISAGLDLHRAEPGTFATARA